MLLRSISINDYVKLASFWKENDILSLVDSKERIYIFLSKNPGLSILAEENNNIIGTILISYDGRRASIQKLVVKKDFRRKGIGKQLVTEAIKRLEKLDVLDIRVNCEKELISFYEQSGFQKDNKALLRIKNL